MKIILIALFSVVTLASETATFCGLKLESDTCVASFECESGCCHATTGKCDGYSFSCQEDVLCPGDVMRQLNTQTTTTTKTTTFYETSTNTTSKSSGNEAGEAFAGLVFCCCMCWCTIPMACLFIAVVLFLSFAGAFLPMAVEFGPPVIVVLFFVCAAICCLLCLCKCFAGNDKVRQNPAYDGYGYEQSYPPQGQQAYPTQQF